MELGPDDLGLMVMMAHSSFGYYSTTCMLWVISLFEKLTYI